MPHESSALVTLKMSLNKVGSRLSINCAIPKVIYGRVLNSMFILSYVPGGGEGTGHNSHPLPYSPGFINGFENWFQLKPEHYVIVGVRACLMRSILCGHWPNFGFAS